MAKAGSRVQSEYCPIIERLGESLGNFFGRGVRSSAVAPPTYSLLGGQLEGTFLHPLLFYPPKPLKINWP